MMIELLKDIVAGALVLAVLALIIGCGVGLVWVVENVENQILINILGGIILTILCWLFGVAARETCRKS